MRETPTTNRPGKEATGGGGPDEGTLGGYMEHHHRPPAFEGADGYPYTVSVEVEEGSDLPAPYSGYLVFPRWAETGVGILGHVETPILLRGKRRREVEEKLGSLTLLEVSDLLREAISRQNEETE